MLPVFSGCSSSSQSESEVVNPPKSPCPSTFASPLLEECVQLRDAFRDLRVSYCRANSKTLPTLDNRVAHQLPEKKVLTFESLSNLYQYDFLAMPAKEKLKEFLKKRELVFSIEKALSGLDSIEVAHECREHVIHLLQLPNQNEALAEMGAMYFYLNKCKNPPCTRNFMVFRQGELHKEIIFLAKNSRGLPSGVPLFILRALSNMVIDKEGKQIPGGIFACIYLIEKMLCCYLKEEHMNHICAVFKQIIFDDEFFYNLAQPLEIHPSMEAMVRNVLLLNEEMKITPHHVRITCLIALLSDLRQYYPNCYAVATVLFATRTRPIMVLEKYQHILSAGHFMVDDNLIPIPPLLEHRLMSEKVLKKIYRVEDLKKSTYIRAIAIRMGLSDEVLNSYEGDLVSLVEFLNWMAEASKSPVKGEHVGAVFTQNLLQEALLNTIEFYEVNLPKAIPSCMQRPIKDSLVDFLHKDLLTQLNLTFPDYVRRPEVRDYLQKFVFELRRSFWLQSSSGLVTVENESVKVILQGGRPVNLTGFEASPLDLALALRKQRRLLYVNQEKVVVVDHYETLKDIIFSIISAVYQRGQQAATPLPDGKFMLFLQGYFLGVFPDILFGFLAKTNRDFPLQQKDYATARVIIFSDDGGTTLDKPLQILPLSFSLEQFHSSDPAENFFKLCDFLHHLPNNKDFLFPHRYFLGKSRNHAFIIQPRNFSNLWFQKTCEEMRRELTEGPMEELLKKALPLEKKEAILKAVFCNDQRAESYLESQPITETAKEFMLQFFDQVEENFHLQFRRLLEFELTKILVSESALEAILQHLPVKMGDVLRSKIKASYNKKFGKMPYVAPFQFAYYLQYILACNKVFLQKGILEKVICKVNSLPCSWAVADDNGGDGAESSEHTLLVLRFLADKWTFVMRTGASERAVVDNDAAALQHLSVLIPKESYNSNLSTSAPLPNA